MVEILNLNPQNIAIDIDKEIGVFEIEEQEEIDRNTTDQPEGLDTLLLILMDEEPDEIIDEGGEDQQDKEKSSRLPVEEQAGQKEESIAEGAVGVKG